MDWDGWGGLEKAGEGVEEPSGQEIQRIDDRNRKVDKKKKRKTQQREVTMSHSQTYERIF